MNPGLNLRMFRRKNGYKMYEVAEKLGISRNTLRDYETNKTVPTFEKMEILCDLYHCTYADIFGIEFSSTTASPDESLSDTMERGARRLVELTDVPIGTEEQMQLYNEGRYERYLENLASAPIFHLGEYDDEDEYEEDDEE